MRARVIVSLGVVLLLLTSLTHTRATLAQGSAEKGHAQTTASARAVELGHQALKLYEQRDFQAALERLSEAERLAHSPVFVLYIARSQRELGRRLIAKALFEQVAVETIPPGAPRAWRDAVQAATLELTSITERIPSLRILVRGKPAPPITLTDGTRELSIAPVETRVTFEPGAHRLVMKDANGVIVERSVELAEGQHSELDFTFPEQQPVAHAKRATKQPAPTKSKLVRQEPVREGATSQSTQVKWGGLTALGIGAGAFAFGIVSGAIALSKAQAIKSNCIDGHCLASDQERADSARRFANLATVGFVVGAVGIGAGVTLLF